MKSRNQYSSYIEDYKISHGQDPFIRYKESDCTNREKEGIESWLFNLMRENGIPRTEVSEEMIVKDLIALSEVNPYEVYHDNAYWFNSSGNLTVKEFFWDKMNQVCKDGKPSIVDQFNNDHQLMRVIKKALTYSYSEMSFFNWLQINGSGYGNSFRPATAKTIYELEGAVKDCKVIDSSSGYYARLAGAHFARNVSEYFGVDPNTGGEEGEKLIDLLDSNQFSTGTKKIVLKMGSEDMTVEKFPELREHFDLAFSSPPYWSTEKYSFDESQSWVKFPTYGEWIKGFYSQTIYNLCDMLNKDGVFAWNIFRKIKSIEEITKLFLADKGFYIVKEIPYMLRTMPGSNHRLDEDGNPEVRDRTIGTNSEPIWFAYHYSRLLNEGLITGEQAIQFRERAIKDKKSVKL